MSEPFQNCRKCGGNMTRISIDNQSPLIVQCKSCKQQEQAIIQISPDEFFKEQDKKSDNVAIEHEDKKHFICSA
ncbi:MAG: hypothetical protein HQL46_03020 [Gammaproteobacteria bacterium]|nr:hypothetical protein [Gammaproteobacteria bacterium]